MTWTTDKPTVPGWYWWRNAQGIIEHHIVWHDEEEDFLCMVTDDGNRIDVGSAGGEWAGPLEAPT
jgi:hypothetical protein